MKNLFAAASAAIIAMSMPALAQDHTDHSHHHHHHNHAGASISGDHHGHVSTAPISIMGDHLHPEGEWMVSYRYMRMQMDGMRDGTDDLSPEEIVSNAALYPNPNPTPNGFRVVPTEMTMEMHMLGLMYGVTDWFTLMAMANYIEKEMDHVTFQGGTTSTTRLGEFTTKSSGIGDTSVTGLFRLYGDGQHHVHLNAGVSIPTGATDESDDVLAPTGLTPTLRLPYAMQLGSGTLDALPGLTYTGHTGAWGWGAQYKGVIRLEDENTHGYSLGDKHVLNAWGTYQFTPWLNGSVRASLETQDAIDGADALITAPVTTADPDNYGGEIAELGAGFNITPAALNGHRIGFDFAAPVYQDLNGPQMKRDYTITGGWVYRF